MREELGKICRDLIAVSFIPGVGPKTIIALLNEGRLAEEAEPVKSSREFLEELEYMEKEGIQPVCFTETRYSETLKNIYDPPPVLFCKGSLRPEDVNAVAIVGSRRCSEYGLRTAEKLAFDLAQRGVTIVSGMAKGIDTAAHRGALNAKGRTIAVMGSGFRHVYPRTAERLVPLIIKNGAVLTEHPSRMLPARANFPRRNRIISGMVKGVVVVEAARKSGATITVNYALEQGREVFAVPGRIDSLTSSGSNKLIQDGAKLITNADDILEELDMNKGAEPVLRAERKETKEEQALTVEEEGVLAAVDGAGPVHIDQILDCTGIGYGRLTEVLLKLEIKGLVKKHAGSRYK
ncbi:MAG: DNA-processing protein DprA [Candidatus Omnitrophota bacterium]